MRGLWTVVFWVGCATPKPEDGPIGESGTDTALTAPTGETGTPPTGPVTDDFVTQTVAVDVVFVVDESASAGSLQTDLAVRTDLLVYELMDELFDYHIGAVSTDIEYRAPGQLLPTEFGADFVTSKSPDAVRATRSVITIGSGGSNKEQGLASLYALSRPGGPGETTGFYRPGAELHVLALSDDDDRSAPAGLPSGDYASWLSGLKPSGVVTFSSFVQTDGEVNGDAFLALTATLGGVVHDIDGEPADWDASVEQFIDQLTRSTRTFALSTTPDPATLRVEVRRDTGAPEPTVIDFEADAWTWDPEPNTVTFDRFVPRLDDEVRITYDRAP